MDEKSIMINLGDKKAKEISEVIGSKTCNKILSLLTEGDLTVTDISRNLKMAINTVDYNVKKLVKSGLIEKASHFWSVKGKKMPTYKVSNKKIIISPRKSRTRVFGWTLGLTGLTALTIREFAKTTLMMGGDMAASGAQELMADVSQKALSETAMAEVMMVAPQSSSSFFGGLGAWSWFLIGAWFAVFVFFVITLINDRRHRL